jgi:hypothetical protein
MQTLEMASSSAIEGNMDTINYLGETTLRY